MGEQRQRMTKSTLATIGLVAAIIVFTGACDSLPTAEDTETEENDRHATGGHP